MKKYLIGFLVGAIIFTGVGIYAETKITADKVTYGGDVSVKDKIDSLYTITNTWKNLSTDTTVDASKLLKDVTAYDSNGDLITGSISADCISGDFLCTTCNVSAGQVILDSIDFSPTKVFLYINSLFIEYYNKDFNDEMLQVQLSDMHAQYFSAEANFDLNNQFKMKGFDGTPTNTKVYYTVCK